ncbi:MAG: hypothetical protein ACHREM_26415 [Polyangiales bacterium]
MALAVALSGCDGCSKENAGGDAAPASSSSATSAKLSASSSAAPMASASAKATPTSPPVGACALEGDSTAVGTLVRADSGVSFGLATKALGWSTKEGAAAVATYGDDGVVTKADVANPSADLDAKAAKGTVRVVKRVVPLDLKDGKVRVAIDYVDIDAAAKHRTLRCGPPDAWLVNFDGASMTSGDASVTTETIDCRTALADKVVAVESTLAKNGGVLTATLALGGVPFAKRDKNEAPSERWGFTMVNAAHGQAGDVVVARYNGLLVVGRKAKETSDFDAWLGTAVTAPVAAFGSNDTVEIWHALAGKPDLYALRFDIAAKKPGSPGTASLGDAPTADERGFLSVTRRELDTIVAMTAKTGDKRSVDLFRYDAAGTLLGRTHLGGTDETVLEAKVAPLAANKVLVAYIVQDGWKNTLKTQVATCGDTTTPVETDR